MSGKIGLVLSGGGAKGAYEVGVYKALSAMGADAYIDTIAGTSVGALNAVLLDSCGAELSEKIWNGLKITDMLNPDVDRLAKIPSIFEYEETDTKALPDDSNLCYLTSPVSTGSLFGDLYMSDITLPDKYRYFDSSSRTLSPLGEISNALSKGRDTIKKFGRKTVDLISSNTGLNIKALSELLKEGLFTQEKIERLIDENVDFDRIYRKIHVVCHDRYSNPKVFELKGYTPQKQKKIVLASSALPIIYTGINGGVEIDGELYSDGGFQDDISNTPVSYIYNTGCRTIIAVHLRYDADLTSQYGMRDADIINIIPSEDLGDTFSGTLNLNPQKVRHDIEMGYNDTISHMGEISAMINRL